MKRKQTSSDDDPLQAPTTPQRRRPTPENTAECGFANGTSNVSSTSTRLRRRLNTKPTNSPADSPIPKSKKVASCLTPKRSNRALNAVENTPSRSRNADRSAKKKSLGILLNPNDDDAWDGNEKLAQQIWDIQDDDVAEDELNWNQENVDALEKTDDASEEPGVSQNHGKQLRARRHRRTPTPEGDIPPHEKYFFQNRPGPVLTSGNTLSNLSLLTHEEYFEHLEKLPDKHSKNKESLLEIHARSFPQWNFELSQGFNVCLYGYGSKRSLLQMFADWEYTRHMVPCPIVIVNGYTTNITIRSVFATIIQAVMGPDTPSKLGTQPTEVLDLLQSKLASNPPARPVLVLLNSIDAFSLRRQSHQALLARLASLPHINFVATADTPNFLLLWDISLRDQFNFAFHDCTTFSPYDIEFNVVDEVHSLLGRKVRRIGGKQGIGFVLKSLPENTRKLYRLLITELLMIMGDQQHSENAEGDEPDTNSRQKDAAIEWRSLFNKATEEFISSSELMFRTQLKEFYDHQMVVSQIDSSGVEMLGVPLSQEEMESVLEDLVIE
ncbi:Origin recognition complex subunit 2 [Ophidiomyces ophidiicola]|nr:Origin recognition complex subunit 2 [Ophidiomyces ophidiicola]